MILEAIDTVYGIGQYVGKHFGFLDPRDGGIEEVSAGGRKLARFGAGGGWEAFEWPLPDDSAFHQAVSGPLRRVAAWTTSTALPGVRDFYERQTSYVPARWVKTDNGLRFGTPLDGGQRVWFKVAARHGATHLVLTQVRDSEALKAGMRERLSALRSDRR